MAEQSASMIETLYNRHHAPSSRLKHLWLAYWPWLLAGAAALAFTAGLGLFFASASHAYFKPGDPRLQPGDAERGRLVFLAGQCASCHALPGQRDRLKLGGGLALSSPYGTFRVPNISQDVKDGIGAWSISDLGNALVSGVSPDGRHYYPVFPYVSYTGMHLQDISDLYSYLKTLPAVAGRPPPHELPLVFRIRRALGVWKLLFFRERESHAVMTGDPVHDRGGYLAENMAHCAECHSTRNIMGAIRQSTRFAGGKDPEDTGYVPNITPTGIGGWSEADLVRMMETGETPNHGRVGSSMADVVVNTSNLTPQDRQAIARYIHSLPPRETPEP